MIIPNLLVNELRKIWLQPLVWVMLGLMFIIMALLFLVLLNNFYAEVQVKYAGIPNAPGVTDTVLSPIYLWSAIIGALTMPLFAMRILTEEKVRRQFVLLSSSPVSCRAIVLSKMLGLFSFVLAFAALNLIFPASIAPFVNLDWGKVLAGVLGIILFQMSYASVCLWLAACTQNLVFAVLSGLGALFLLFVLYMSGASTNSESALFIYLSNFSHFLPFLAGLISSKDILYFLIVAALFSGLAVIRLRFKRI